MGDPPKKKIRFQNLHPDLRKHITEFLQPTQQQQNRLANKYYTMARDGALLKQFQDAGDDPMFIDMLKRSLKQSRSHYHEYLEKVSNAPQIWESYRYFWDDSTPFPDQGPNPGTGGNAPITT